MPKFHSGQMASLDQKELIANSSWRDWSDWRDWSNFLWLTRFWTDVAAVRIFLHFFNPSETWWQVL